MRMLNLWFGVICPEAVGVLWVISLSNKSCIMGSCQTSVVKDYVDFWGIYSHCPLGAERMPDSTREHISTISTETQVDPQRQ